MSTRNDVMVQPRVRERSSGIDRLMQTLRTHPLEILVFGLSIALLLTTIVVTVRVALDADTQTQDLTFGGTLDELALVLSNSGFDQLATLEHATLRPSGNPIAVDTIAILADPEDEPAAAPGGFIADQVAMYNDHAIRQALIHATLGSAAANGVTDAPSLFRTVRTENGERRLSERPNPFVLTVRSPYAERTWREVRTADWSSSGSLLGLGGEIALGGDAVDRSRARLNERDCTIRRNAQRFLLYCGTALASDVGRFYDIGFELNPLDPTLGPARASLYRPGTLWRNGESASFTEGDVRAGDVFDLESTGPFMLSVSQRGTLAAGQWINGRQSFSNQSLGTISFFAAAGRASAATSTTPLVLSLDASLSTDLEHEARRFLEAQPALRRMSIVVMDVRTGELLAIAEPARRSDGEPLIAFEPLLVGSVVKPLVASAIIARQPQLAALTLNYAGDTVRVVANVPLERGFANAANGCAGGIAFTDFIRCSSNQYAAELLVRSLRADGYGGSAGGNAAAADTGAAAGAGGGIRTDGVVPREILERSAIGAGLAEAFDVDAFGFRTAGRNPSLWTVANQTAAGTGDRTLLPWESRPWLLFPETEGTRLDLLARYAFGGWENRWTLLGLAEAYARIATGKEVRARIVSDSSSFGDVPANVGNAFRRVRTGLRQVPVSGTASGLAADVSDALGRDVFVLAKTGTLNEQRDRFRSLALVLGQTGTASAGSAGSTQGAGAASRMTAPSAPLTCGLVAISWFEFHDGVARPSSLPPVHLDFARGELASVLRRHWDRVSGCAADAAGATGTTNPPAEAKPGGAANRSGPPNPTGAANPDGAANPAGVME